MNDPEIPADPGAAIYRGALRVPLNNVVRMKFYCNLSVGLVQ